MKIKVGDYVYYGDGEGDMVTSQWLQDNFGGLGTGMDYYSYLKAVTVNHLTSRNRNATYTGAGKYYHSSLEEMIRGLAGRSRPGLTYDERMAAENERNARLIAKDHRDMLAMQQRGEARKILIRRIPRSSAVGVKKLSLLGERTYS